MKCSACRKPFKEVVWLSYFEYTGASAQQEPVSPCCNGNYEEDGS